MTAATSWNQAFWTKSRLFSDSRHTASSGSFRVRKPVIPKAPLTDSRRGFPEGEISDSFGAGDSRHVISGEIARGLFGGGASGVGPAVEDRPREPSASVVGCGQGWNGSGRRGEDRRHGSADAARLGSSLQRFGAGGPHRQPDGRSQASLVDGTVGSVYEDRGGRPGP